MKKLFIAILFMLWVPCTSMANISTDKDDSLRYEVLLTSKMLNDIHLNDQFISDLEITTNRLILLSTSTRFYLLGWGGIEPMGKEVIGKISSFSFTPDNLLMAIQNNELCAFDSLGSLTKLFNLPSQSMGISAGKNTMYVYDRNKDKQKYSIYMIAKGGKYVRLFDFPSPISSIVESNHSILFATKNVLLSFSFKESKLKIITALQNDREIKSIAMDSLNNRIYLSTENELYAMKDSSLVTISNQLGGVLRYFNDGLLVFNPEKKLLIRIVGLENQMAPKVQELNNPQPVQQPDDLLTNETIIGLVQSKLSDGLIINLINRSRVDFNLNINSMIYLSSQHVSSAIIMAMKNAMKKTTSGEPLNKTE